MTSNELMTLEYTGPGQGGQWFRCPSGRQYRAGRGPAVRYIQAPADDAQHLQGLGFFTPVPPPAAFVPPPAGVVSHGTAAESATAPADDGGMHAALFAVPPPEGTASPYPGPKRRKT
jgi:hypothetical protein